MTRAAAKAQAAAGTDVHVDEDHNTTPNAPEAEVPFWDDKSSSTKAPTDRTALEPVNTNIDSGSFRMGDVQERQKMAGSRGEAVAQDEDLPAQHHTTHSSDAVQRLESLFQTQPHNEENEEATIHVILSRRGSILPEMTMQQMVSTNDVDGGHAGKMDDVRVNRSANESTVETREVVEKEQELAQPQKQVHDHEEVTTSRAQVGEETTANGQKHIPDQTQRITPVVKPRQTAVAPTQVPSQIDQVKSKSNISALHTPPRATKSNKPVTKSSFQLPGEAIAAKLKAQREERLRRAEEEEKKRKEFKARPMMKPTKPLEFKATLTSRARMSLMQERSQDVQKPVDVIAERSKLSNRPSLPANRHAAPGRPSFAASVGTSRFAASTRSPLITTQPTTRRPMSNSSATAKKPAIRASIPAKTKEDVNNASLPPRRMTKATGAEVFRRPMLQKAEEEKALKEKIEAQKKARMEAAERSKNLARAFAEKKKSASQASSRNVSGPLAGTALEKHALATVDAATASATAMKWARKLSAGRDFVAEL